MSDATAKRKISAVAMSAESASAASAENKSVANLPRKKSKGIPQPQPQRLQEETATRTTTTAQPCPSRRRQGGIGQTTDAATDRTAASPDALESSNTGIPAPAAPSANVEGMQPSQPHEDRELTPKQERLFYSELKDASGVRIPLKGKVRLGGGILGTLVHHYVPDQCPNVFLLEGFITLTELDYIKRYAATNGTRFQASYVDAAGGSREVTTDHRRSLFLPLPTDKSTVARRMADRAAKTVYLDHNTVETPQLVTYIGNGKEGQYFREHHDVADHFERGGDGRVVVYESEASQKTAGFYRLFTVFAYVNDVPNGEGATVFPELGIRGEPRAGNALLWPNVRPDGSVEPSTVHEAQTVRASGVQKLGMNLWVTSLDMSDQQEARKGAIYKLPDMKTPKRFLPWLRRFGLMQAGADPEAGAEES